MTHRSFLALSLLSAFWMTVFPCSLEAGGFTAKSSLPTTLPIAKKWLADAVLTSISSLEVNADGTAKWWIHSFHSPSTKRHLSITVKPGSIDTLEVRTGFTKPIGDDFIDSDKAMAEAKKNGLKGQHHSMGVNVLGTGSTVYWSVTGGYKKGDVAVTLDAKSGKFLRKDVIPGF
jgi:hypothetical protein